MRPDDISCLEPVRYRQRFLEFISKVVFRNYYEKGLAPWTDQETLEKISVKFEGPEFIEFTHNLKNNNLEIGLSVVGENYGEHEGKIFINHEKTQYTIPVLMHYTKGSILVNQENEKLFFEIEHPDKWSFAKISVINSKNGNMDTTTTTPNKKTSIEIYENGEYWIEAKIKVNGNTSDAFNTIKINSLSEKIEKIELTNIPEKQIIIIISIVTIVGIVGLLIRK